ncbi:phage tail-like protein [Kribbella rubisoli]|uniref:Phage tail-like protein n=1 Tax=Kribbella rubisoli TaxID=3075929 RepID=A0A4Q7WMM8_9ACTN|nr:phage tail protein [Kribbella rubisoli]RZU11352.1 phage tail-like protein [Kribbella rubisoli]
MTMTTLPAGLTGSLSRLSEPDQWLRCHHNGTSLLDDGHGFELAWTVPSEANDDNPPAAPAGLAIDRWGRAYRSEPALGKVVVLPHAVLEPPADGTAHPGALERPRGLAIDQAQRLYVAEPGRARVLVVDLWSQRLLRAVPTPGSSGGVVRRPVDVATADFGVLALLDGPPSLVAIRGRRGPIPAGILTPPPGAGGLRPSRLVCHPTAGVLVLWTSPEGPEAVICTPEGRRPLSVPGATDLEVNDRQILVVAVGPGRPLLAWRDDSGSWIGIEPQAAPGYDGAALGVDLDGGVVYTIAGGMARMAGSAAVYQSSGRLLTYRLDSGRYRAQWGRVFIDACIPPGTALRLAAVTTDVDEVIDSLPPRAPDHESRSVPYAELTPPLPPAELIRDVSDETTQPLYHRTAGRERPWEQIPSDDGYETYEAPVNAPPGRYLWLVIDLDGSAKASPRVREVRVEKSGHRLATQLPRGWSRDESDAAFLQRFLAPSEGMLRDLDARAEQRSYLLDPLTAPVEALDWLAGFLGMVLDRRWPLSSRRELVAQVYDLYRLRGTRAALEQILTLYLRRDVAIVENWRLRGLGGSVLGPPTTGPRPPFIASAGRAVEPLGSFSVGGPLPGANDVLGDDDAIAHRFTVILPTPVDRDERAVLTSIIEAQKPAHTRADVCEFGAGMRIGRFRTGLTSFVAVDSGWVPEIAGQVFLGANGIVGVPDRAAQIENTAIGRVRIG